MKNYELLKLEVEMLDSSDVIATSGAVTTEEIRVPWASAYETE